jgi:large subunit ribosomal protein L17
MAQRKLGCRNAAQRKALLRNQVTNLIWYGRIETTLARAKEVRSMAEHLITLAINECDNNVQVEKTFNNDKGQTVTVTVQNDAPSKLHARRQIMAYLYEIKEAKQDDESKSAYRARTKDNKYPCVEKLFREIGPKYKARNAEKNCAGGYTRIIKKGPRRGDAAEMVILELIEFLRLQKKLLRAAKQIFLPSWGSDREKRRRPVEGKQHERHDPDPG